MRYTSLVLESPISRGIGQLTAEAPDAVASGGRIPASSPAFASVREYAIAVLGVAALTIACWLLKPLIDYGAISLIFLLGVLLAGMVLNRGPVLLVAALSALSWNFLFIPPLFTLHIAKFDDALTFATYFIIAITVGSLTAQLKAREHLAAQIQLAHESERLRKTLLDCVSHELKTPLAAIGAASQELVRVAPNVRDAQILTQLAGEIHDG
jgi:K+-sensing histidine kinase KdpD